jgi:S1-C subfamily serine protease
MDRMTRRNALIVVLLTAALIAGNAWVSVAEVSSDVIEQAIPRTVFLVILVRVPGEEGKLRPAGSCSGAFVSATGLILTASHCVRATSDEAKIGIKKGEMFHPDGLMAVALNVPDQARPVLLMLAKTVGDDPKIDMALLKVAAVLGRGGPEPVPPDLRVPYMVIGNSDSVRHGESVAVIGFPGVGGDTVTANKGNVTGFTADDQNRKLDMKLDAGVGPGSSGGPVITERGEQVAVLSSGVVDTQNAARSVRAPLTNRMPSAWAQMIKDALPGAPRSPAPGSQPPASAPNAPTAPAEGVTVIQGRIVDASTGAGIQGAGVFVLRPGASPDSATKQDVIASGVTDGNGLFQIKPPVRRGATYPIVILASGYSPVAGTLDVPAAASDVISAGTVQLQRR